jgi:hypothetical protein
VNAKAPGLAPMPGPLPTVARVPGPRERRAWMPIRARACFSGGAAPFASGSRRIHGGEGTPEADRKKAPGLARGASETAHRPRSRGRLQATGRARSRGLRGAGGGEREGHLELAGETFDATITGVTRYGERQPDEADHARHGAHHEGRVAANRVDRSKPAEETVPVDVPKGRSGSAPRSAALGGRGAAKRGRSHHAPEATSRSDGSWAGPGSGPLPERAEGAPRSRGTRGYPRRQRPEPGPRFAVRGPLPPHFASRTRTRRALRARRRKWPRLGEQRGSGGNGSACRPKRSR